MQHDTGLIDTVRDFYQSWYAEEIASFAQGFPKDRTVLEVDFRDVRHAIPDVADDYEQQPEFIREHFEQALQHYDLPAAIDLSGASVRLTNLNDALDHRVRLVGEWMPDEIANTFAVLRGQVSKRTQGKILVSQAYFECQRCGSTTAVDQDSTALSSGSNGLNEPHECSGCERQGPFMLDEDRTIESGENFQIIRLQRPPEADGQTQESIDVQLRGDLVDRVRPGDRVAVGTSVSGRISDGGDEPTMELYGEAESVERLESDFSDVDTAAYEDRINEIANSEDPYQTVIDSILPSHRGDETLKEAIAYQLFGGVKSTRPDGSKRRGTIHIFAVGDPGVGKSTLLRYVQRLAPRSVFTTGTGSTAAGLTCAAMKDDFGDGGWTLEAGALVEANNGVCCIDELDDMTEEDRAGLLEAMSDQRISVSKAGINAELPAKTRVLAAANPEMGRFDEYEPIAEQIVVDPVLLSRFDLVFTMTDEVDPEEDKATAAHINGAQDVEPPITPEVMRAYVALARDKEPELTDAADEAIQQEYARFRQINEDSDAIPTTPRMVGALNRLSAAAARIRLGSEITVDDVERAIDIYHASMEDTGVDPESGDYDADVIETGTSDAQRTRVNRIKTVIRSVEDDFPDKGAPKEAVEDHGQLSEFDDAKVQKSIEQLMDKGVVYEPRDGFYRVVD